MVDGETRAEQGWSQTTCHTLYQSMPIVRGHTSSMHRPERKWVGDYVWADCQPIKDNTLWYSEDKIGCTYAHTSCTSSPITIRPCASSLGDMPITAILTALLTARVPMALIALSSSDRREKGFTTREIAPSSILLMLSTSFKVLLMKPAAASIMATTSSLSVSASL